MQTAETLAQHDFCSRVGVWKTSSQLFKNEFTIREVLQSFSQSFGIAFVFRILLLRSGIEYFDRQTATGASLMLNC